MADPHVAEAQGIFVGTAGSTSMSPGDMAFFDGTDWELADSSDNTKYAEAMVINGVSSGEQVALCTEGIIVDTDAPYTQGDNYFLSETAGEVTATRPTTGGSLRQVVAYGLSTTELRVTIHAPYEHHEVYRVFSSVTTEGVAALDSGNFYGVTGNADAEVLSATWSVPQNCIGLEYARIFAAGEVVTGATDITVTVSGAADGEQWDATTQDATLTTLVVTGAVADEMQGSDLTTGIDAAGIIEPDNCVGLKAVYDGGQTDVVHFFNIEVVYILV